MLLRDTAVFAARITARCLCVVAAAVTVTSVSGWCCSGREVRL